MEPYQVIYRYAYINTRNHISAFFLPPPIYRLILSNSIFKLVDLLNGQLTPMFKFFQCGSHIQGIYYVVVTPWYNLGPITFLFTICTYRWICSMLFHWEFSKDLEPTCIISEWWMPPNTCDISAASSSNYLFFSLSNEEITTISRL